MAPHPQPTADGILLVEDDENDAFFLRHALSDAGCIHPVNVVKHGQQAIDYLAGAGEFADRNRHPLPRLLLLDLKLPGLGGLDVLGWLRQQPVLSTLVVIVFTSSQQPADIERAYRLGANAFLIKSGDPRELAAVARFLVGWLRHNRFPDLRKSTPAH
jgi:CheY-like chemotaxis protein